MNGFDEGLVAIFVCLTVLNGALFGAVIYGVYYISQIRKESKVERLKVQVLIDSMIEIFESKHKLYDDENEKGSGGIPHRD